MFGNDVSLNGVQLSDLGIHVVKVGTGVFSNSPFLPSVEILEDYAMNNDIPYYFGVRKKPLELEVTFSKLEGYWTWEARREFANLLTPEHADYIEFYYHEEDEPIKIYYVKYINGIDLVSNNIRQGYLTVHFRCDSPYAYTPFYEKIIDLSTSTSPLLLTMANEGDEKCYPELWIKKVGSGTVKIRNLTNAGKEFVLTNLLDGEEVYIDNENGTIESSLSDTLRYDNHNGIYICLVKGENRLEIAGKCILKWRYRFKIKG